MALKHETSPMRNMTVPRVDYQNISARDPSRGSLENLLIAAVVVTALYFGRDVFVPLSLAMLLSFALGPLVLLLHRWHFNRILSVMTVVGFTFVLTIGISLIIGSQIANFAENLPRYQSNITEKIHSVRDAATSSGMIGRSFKFLSDLGHEISTPGEAPGNPASLRPLAPRSGARSEMPTLVEIRPADLTPLQLITQVVTPLLQPLATAVIVVVFVIFFLMKREDLRDRFIRLAGTRDLQRTTHALHDATRRLSRYLLFQVAINASLGLAVGTALWFIGLPNPILWGALAMLLRFVPYIGPVIAVSLPAALAVAVDPGWMMLIWVVGIFAVAEGISETFEPWLYGQSTGLSGVAIVVAAAFWTLLWGPIGLLLSTPLTMCLVVLGRHVTNLQFLEVMFGDRPALAPDESFYQCILVDDPDEAARQAETLLKDMDLAAYYDDVALRGLMLAQTDVSRGALDLVHQVRIKEAVNWVIDDLSGHETIAAEPIVEGETAAASPVRVFAADDLPPSWREMPVLCVGGRSALDEAAAAMLVQLLKGRGLGARVVSPDEVSIENLSQVEMAGVQAICLSYLEPGSLAHPRYLVRRLRRRLPHAIIIDGFWALTPQEVEERNTLSITGADLIATSLREAMEQIISTAVAAGGLESATDRPTAQGAHG